MSDLDTGEYQISGEYPHRDEELLRRLYHDEGLTQREVADVIGCHYSTVDDWMSRLGVEKRSKSEARGGGVSFRFGSERGYPTLSISHGTSSSQIRVHQLVAVAHGADPHRVYSGGDYHVHHRNRMTADNRPENLNVVEAGEHIRDHGLPKEFHGPYEHDERGRWVSEDR